jgi:hypothetical protein
MQNGCNADMYAGCVDGWAAIENLASPWAGTALLRMQSRLTYDANRYGALLVIQTAIESSGWHRLPEGPAYAEPHPSVDRPPALLVVTATRRFTLTSSAPVPAASSG